MRLKWAGQVEAVVPASPDAVWSVLTDPARVGEWSHEAHSVDWVEGDRAALGARFCGHNRTGRSTWSRVCTITGFEPASVFEYVTWGGVPKDSTRWRFELAPQGEGTRIVQSFEILKLSRAWETVIYLLVPVHRDRSQALRGDLERLGEVAALPNSPDTLRVTPVTDGADE